MTIQTKKKPKKQYKRDCGNCGKKVTYFHRHKPKVCPFCKHKHWDKPETEVWLFDLQEQYLLTRDPAYLAKMYEILCDYAQSLIFKILSGNVIYSQDKLREKSHDAANSIIRYYLEKPSFQIDRSFGGYLKFKVKEVLYSDKNEEDHISLNSIQGSEDSDKEMIETLELFGYDLIFRDEKTVNNHVDPVSDILRIIDLASGEVRRNFSPMQSIILLAGIRQQVDGKNQSIRNRFYQHFGNRSKRHIDIVMKEIFNHLQGMRTA